MYKTDQRWVDRRVVGDNVRRRLQRWFVYIMPGYDVLSLIQDGRLPIIGTVWIKEEQEYGQEERYTAQQNTTQGNVTQASVSFSRAACRCGECYWGLHTEIILSLSEISNVLELPV